MKRTGAVLFAAACLFSLFLPLPQKISKREWYECVWSDGSTSVESYTSAYQSLAGMDGESILLSRQGLTGRIASEAGQVYSALSEGTLGEILACTYDGTRLDGAALYRSFQKRVWYSGAYFVWTGNQMKRVSSAKGGEVVLLSGSVTSRILKETNAQAVELRADATIHADTFLESSASSLKAEQPYFERGGAIYMDMAGGKRLIASLPVPDALSLDGDLVFADKGALVACQSLQSLTVPFLGSALLDDSAGYTGIFAYLFASGSEYLVPSTLTHVRVTGGRVVAYAFYACSSLREIDVCKVEPSAISTQAFLGLNALELLHTPKADVQLDGEFTSYTAECGCRVFERVHAQK